MDLAGAPTLTRSYKYQVIPHDAGQIRRSLERKFNLTLHDHCHESEPVAHSRTSVLASTHQSSTTLVTNHSSIEKPYRDTLRLNVIRARASNPTQHRSLLRRAVAFHCYLINGPRTNTLPQWPRQQPRSQRLLTMHRDLLWRVSQVLPLLSSCSTTTISHRLSLRAASGVCSKQDDYCETITDLFRRMELRWLLGR